MTMHNRVFEPSLHWRQADRGSGEGGAQQGQQGQQRPGSQVKQAASEQGEGSQSSTGTTETSSNQSSGSLSPTTTSSSSESSTTSTSTSTSTSSTTTSISSATSTTSLTPVSTSTSTSAILRTSESTPTSTSTSTSSSTTSTRLSTSSSSQSTLLTSSTNPPVPVGNIGSAAFTATDGGFTNGFRPTDTSSAPGSTGSSESSPAVSGSLNTGAVAGGVVGGLVGIAVLGALIVMFLRRKRAKDTASQFDAAQFRRSAMIMEDGNGNSNVDGHFPSSDPLPPPIRREMIFQGRDRVASARSSQLSAGMAGQGAWGFHADGDQDEYQQYIQYQDEPTTTGHPVAVAVAGYHDAPQLQLQPQQEAKNSAEYYSDNFTEQLQTRQAIQPRQQYTFGQAIGNRNVISDDGHPDDADAPSLYSVVTPRQSARVVENPFSDGRVVENPFSDVNSGIRNSTATVDAYGGI